MELFAQEFKSEDAKNKVWELPNINLYLVVITILDDIFELDI